MAPSYQAPYDYMKLVWSAIPPFPGSFDEEILYEDDSSRRTQINGFIAAAVTCTDGLHVDHEALFEPGEMMYRQPAPFATHPERRLAVAMLDNILTTIFEFIESSTAERLVAPGEEARSRAQRRADRRHKH